VPGSGKNKKISDSEEGFSFVTNPTNKKDENMGITF
jgi:hypothetical protein